MVRTTLYSRRENRGAALLTALAVLFLFSLLGTTYLRYMSIVGDKTALDVRLIRSRHMAGGGVQAAMGEIQAVLNDPDALRDLQANGLEIAFPVYQANRAEATGLVPRERRRGITTVTVTDESGKVNLNHAPLRVLRAILGVDSATARNIADALPSAGAAGEASASDRRWLAGLDDLVNRGLVPPAAYKRLNKNLLTVHTVAHHARPSAFVNVNAAPPEVLAALLDVPREAAASLIAARPFKDLAGLSAAAGKPAATFNLRPAPETPQALPEALCFESRCFRIVSRASVSDLGPNDTEYRTMKSRVEAVVIFGDGAPCITYWSEAPERES